MSAFFICCCGNICSFICCHSILSTNQESLIRKIKVVLEKDNLEKWHPRGITWAVDYQLLYISLNFNWDVATN